MLQQNNHSIAPPAPAHSLPGVDFVRVICAYSIVCFHFSCHSISPAGTVFLPGKFGTAYVAVGIFFIISGLVLRWNYPTVPDIKRFYYKRGKALLPMFWIAYWSLFALRVLHSGRAFFSLPISRLLLSVIAMDGYSLYKIPNYYQIGEWFLGAIILLYLLYPIVNRLFSRSSCLTYLAGMGLFFFVVYGDAFEIPKNFNLLYCLGYFITGMFLAEHKVWMDSKIILAAAVLSLAFLVFAPIPLTDLTNFYFQTVCTFIILYRIGCFIRRWALCERLCAFGAKLSYPLFLVHHVVILALLAVINLEAAWFFWCMLAVSLLISTLGAWVLLLVTQALGKYLGRSFGRRKISV